MSVVGNQDFWKTGSYLYFIRDAIEGVLQPWRDVGLIDTASPTVTIEKNELEDPRSGVKKTVDEAVTKIDEEYDVTLRNISLQNLAIALLGKDPEEFTQLETERNVATYAHPGELAKIVDASDELIYNVKAMVGVYKATETIFNVTDVDQATKTLTVDSDPTGDLSNGDSVVLHEVSGGSAVAATYSVASLSPTTVVLNEDPGGDATGGKVVKGLVVDTDYSVHTLDDGFVRMLPGSTEFTAAGLLQFVFLPTGLTGLRLMHPQSQKNTIKGRAFISYSRGDNAEKTQREFRCSITPNGANLQLDQYSELQLKVKVLNDLTTANPAGRIVHSKGDVPSQS